MPEPLTLQLLAEVLGDLTVAFPRNKSDNLTALANVYRNGLTGLSGDSVREAARRAIQADQFFPKVARLRELASGYDRQRTITIRPQSSEGEWGVCPVCFARTEQRPFYRKGEIVGYRDHLTHDRIRHGLYEQANQEGAA